MNQKLTINKNILSLMVSHLKGLQYAPLCVEILQLWMENPLVNLAESLSTLINSKNSCTYVELFGQKIILDVKGFHNSWHAVF